MSKIYSSSFSRRDALRMMVAPIALTMIGCGGNSFASNSATRSVSYRWTSTLLDAISNATLGPPMTARAIGMVSTAAYDAWSAYNAVAVGTRLGGTLRRPLVEHTLANKEQAVSFAIYRVLVDLYPAQLARFNTMMADLGYNPANTTTDVSTPEGIGNVVAAEILAFRHIDGSNQLAGYADTTGFVPVNTPDTVVDPSKWQQLRFANGSSPGFIAPHWGNVVPFALTSPSALRPPPPPTFGSPTHRDQAQAVVDLTAGLDDTKKVIAEYWADGPRSVQPPGHWQLFGQFVSARDAHTIDEDVKMFFMLGNAVFDAGVACWDCKRFFNSSRPITVIRNYYAGQTIRSFVNPTTGFADVDGSQWLPYQSPNFITPPFPEYTSGHSTFSAAAAEILKRFTGSDFFGNSVTVAADSLVFDPTAPDAPITLSWGTFSDAADQAGSSRLYGGIHFRAGDLEGRNCGRAVGEQVFNTCMSFINGTASAPRV